MRSIIDEIALAEAQADEIRKEAAQKAREDLLNAKGEAESSMKQLGEAERELSRQALQKADSDGQKLSQEMLNGMLADADAQCDTARGRVDNAVAYLLGRLTAET